METELEIRQPTTEQQLATLWSRGRAMETELELRLAAVEQQLATVQKQLASLAALTAAKPVEPLATGCTIDYEQHEGIVIVSYKPPGSLAWIATCLWHSALAAFDTDLFSARTSCRARIDSLLDARDLSSKEATWAFSVKNGIDELSSDCSTASLDAFCMLLNSTRGIQASKDAMYLLGCWLIVNSELPLKAKAWARKRLASKADIPWQAILQQELART